MGYADYEDLYWKAQDKIASLQQEVEELKVSDEWLNGILAILGTKRVDEAEEMCEEYVKIRNVIRPIPPEGRV